MFSILVDGVNLGNSLAAMRANGSECLATFPTPDVMFMRSMDLAKVCIAECKTKVVVTGESRDLGLDLQQLDTDLSGPVEMEVEDRILIHAGRVTHKIGMTNPSYIAKVPEPKIPWPLVFDLPATELKIGLKAVCDKIPTKEAQEGILISWTGDTLVIEDSTCSKVDVQYGIDELNIRTPCTTPLRTLIPIDYGRAILPTISKLDRCVVGLGQDMPITFGGSNSSLSMGVGYIISNRLVKD